MSQITWILNLEPGRVYAITPRFGPLTITNAATSLKVVNKRSRSALELAYLPDGSSEEVKSTIASFTVGFSDHAKMEIPLERAKKYSLEILGPNPIDVMGLVSVEKTLKGPPVEAKIFPTGTKVLGNAKPGRSLRPEGSALLSSTTTGKRKNPPAAANAPKNAAAASAKKPRAVSSVLQPAPKAKAKTGRK
ncbi:hypothetical protein CC1G_12382 [Coprinopsis cinerea okayama7|uniref:Nucleoplasmin-like domain-containing protein n=1 Tax=Coprinopsis cinerea (strain Okayama-7 / 130 / ATCC MYA-4618 / FGSC 9003) TaxID=240176 RepID=A8NLS1_COPC7|nr:hypothetical protein CC1G_12382 [Coprinopsis cinerea okayama7\|eukprot:XP_001834762.1 hypothetical protein CC1G_12382 [Coprinopsis cinerea okayama7\